MFSRVLALLLACVFLGGATAKTCPIEINGAVTHCDCGSIKGYYFCKLPKSNNHQINNIWNREGHTNEAHRCCETNNDNSKNALNNRPTFQNTVEPQNAKTNSQEQQEIADENESNFGKEFRGIGKGDFPTWIIAILTLIGVALLAKTLKETRRARKLTWNTLKSTRTATKAAMRATNVTREMGMAQTRAYLNVIGGSYKFTDNIKEMEVTIEIKNSGNSPATNVELDIGFYMTENGEPIFSEKPGKVWIDRIGARSKLQRSATIKGIDAPIGNLLANREGSFRIFGDANYSHIFHKNGEIDTIAFGFFAVHKDRDGVDSRTMTGRFIGQDSHGILETIQASKRTDYE